jgi:hypothetical protein
MKKRNNMNERIYEKIAESLKPKETITRCKNCIHFKIKGDVVKYGYCDMWNYPIDEFGFCYLGRKE